MREHGGIHDIRENEGHGAVRGGALRKIGPFELERLLELLEGEGELHAEYLHVCVPRQRPVDLDDLPLAVLEVEDVRRAQLGKHSVALGPPERDHHPGPTDRALLPGLDLAPVERETAGLFDLAPPDSPLRGVPPLARVGPDCEQPGPPRDPR